jgi:hypothetical protein
MSFNIFISQRPHTQTQVKPNCVVTVCGTSIRSGNVSIDTVCRNINGDKRDLCDTFVISVFKYVNMYGGLHYARQLHSGRTWSGVYFDVL